MGAITRIDMSACWQFYCCSERPFESGGGGEDKCEGEGGSKGAEAEGKGSKRQRQERRGSKKVDTMVPLALPSAARVSARG